MNTTSWLPLNWTSTLLAVHQNPTGFAPDGVGLGAGDQLLVTEDSIQVLDLRVVRVLVPYLLVLFSDPCLKGQPGRRRSPVPLARTPPLDVRGQS
jgi:hypothetical protein